MSDYVPKRKYNQYPKEALEEAISDVKNDRLDLWEAAKHYKIPYKTLKNKVEGKHTGKVGAKCILSLEEENQIVNWIQQRARMGFPLAKDEVLEAARKIANRNGGKQFSEQGLITFLLVIAFIPCILIN